MFIITYFYFWFSSRESKIHINGHSKCWPILALPNLRLHQMLLQCNHTAQRHRFNHGDRV